MDANEQRAVALLKEAAGGNAVIHPDMGYVNIEWALRAIMAALAQQVPADGEWVLVPRGALKLAADVAGDWLDLFPQLPGPEKYDRYTYGPEVEQLRDDLRAMLVANAQAPQPVVDASQPQQGAAAVPQYRHVDSSDWYDGTLPSNADGEFETRVLYTQPPAPAVDVKPCCECSAPVGTRENGTPGAELSDGRWVCSDACWERATADTPAVQIAAPGDVELGDVVNEVLTCDACLGPRCACGYHARAISAALRSQGQADAVDALRSLTAAVRAFADGPMSSEVRDRLLLSRHNGPEQATFGALCTANDKAEAALAQQASKERP